MSKAPNRAFLIDKNKQNLFPPYICHDVKEEKLEL